MKIEVEQTKNFRELAKLSETVQTWHHIHYPDEFKPFDMNEMENTFEKLIEDNNVFAFIASYQNTPIGYLMSYVQKRPESAFQYERTVLYIDQIAVIQEYQKNGVGKLFMEKVYELAKRKQITEIQLDFWEGNQLAEHFFLRNGFNYFNQRMKKYL